MRGLPMRPMRRRSRSIRWCPRLARLIAAFVCFGLSACEPKLRSNTEKTAAEPSEATKTDESNLAFPSLNPAPAAAPIISGLTIPHRRSIKNLAGVSLDGEILAKSGDEIAFRRDFDGLMFLIALPTLSPVDQLAIHELPDTDLALIESLRPAATADISKNRPPLLTELQPHGTFEAAKSASKASGRPLLVIVTGVPDEPIEGGDELNAPIAGSINPAASRKACLSLIRTVLGDRSFAGFVNEHYEYYYLDRLDERDLSAPELEAAERVCQECRIVDYPATILYSPDEQEILRLEGYDGKGPRRFMGLLEGGSGK